MMSILHASSYVQKFQEPARTTDETVVCVLCCKLLRVSLRCEYSHPAQRAFLDKRNDHGRQGAGAKRRGGGGFTSPEERPACHCDC